jgi:hypothetical protein
MCNLLLTTTCTNQIPRGRCIVTACEKNYMETTILSSSIKIKKYIRVAVLDYCNSQSTTIQHHLAWCSLPVNRSIPEAMYRQQRNAAANQMAMVQLPEVDEVGAVIVRHARQFAVRHKYFTAYYLLGLLLLGTLTVWGGRSLTPDETRQYNAIMGSIDLQAEYNAVDKYWNAQSRYQATKGWFWSCDGVCQQSSGRARNARFVLAVSGRGKAICQAPDGLGYHVDGNSQHRTRTR